MHRCKQDKALHKGEATNILDKKAHLVINKVSQKPHLAVKLWKFRKEEELHMSSPGYSS